jgi:hexosaminidase
MHYKTFQIKCFLFILSIFAVFTQCSETKIEYSLIPVPVAIEYQSGGFMLSNQTNLSTEDEFKRSAEYLQNRILELAGITLTGNEANPQGTIHLLHDSSLRKDEGYSLLISGKLIEIKAKNESGIFYGIQTLLQIITEASNFQVRKEISIRNLTITDYPRFKWRGMHLDVSRHFFPADFIRKYIDILAIHKINVFHWHLVDDQGWRIEIKKYPELTRKGAWRKGTGLESWTYFVEPANAQDAQDGVYYTQEEIKHLVEYAAQRQVTIVPEIEIPGHSWAALYAYPELSCSGIPWKKPNDVPFEFSDPYCAGNEKTFEFLEDVLKEVFELFPAEYIHIGGDEAKKTPWEKCPKCRQRMKTEGLKNVEKLQSYFIRRIEKFIKGNGRKIIGWDEILEGGLAPEAAVMSWRGEEGGIEAADLNHQVVMTPGEYTYLSNYQFNPADDGAAGSPLTLEKVYRYDPIPKDLKKVKENFIIGAQGCLWTENTQTTEEAEFQILPRLCALAEVVWSPKEKRDYRDFLRRMRAQYHRLSQAGINYFVALPSGFEKETVFLKQLSLEMTNPIGYGDIFYTLDGSEPTISSPKYSTPLQPEANVMLKAKIILPTGKASLTKTGQFIKQEPLAGVEMSGDFFPGVQYQYFTGAIQSLSQFSELVYEAKGTVDDIRIPPDVREDLYGIEFQGFLKIRETGVYTLYTTSDDGSQLFLHDKLFIDNDGIHGPQIKQRQVALKKGIHPIKILFFEGRYGQHLEAGFIHQENRKEPFKVADLLH